MTPWIQCASRDQFTLCNSWPLSAQKSKQLLPWQSFPAWLLYASCALAVLGTATGMHHLLAQRLMSGGHWTGSLLCVVGVAAWAPVLSIIPCLGLFVLSVYCHALACSPPEDSGDCTRFVRFRDPVLQARFRGKRIDMESLYEMYFDCKLDFVAPSDRDACDADRPLCLMRDVLARRSEFVRYTFGLTTHLRFLLLQWVPDVLSHSKQQDMAQVLSRVCFSQMHFASPI